MDSTLGGYAENAWFFARENRHSTSGAPSPQCLHSRVGRPPFPALESEFRVEEAPERRLQGRN